MSPAPCTSVRLGLGLLSIGKTWGFRPAPLPSDADVAELLDTALAGGVRFLDTAASYGAEGEARLGKYLRGLEPRALAGVTIATKCGEHWDAASSAPFVDHSYDALARSIDRSLERLPVVHLLQIHKSSPRVVEDSDVRRALEYARARGVREFGVSASDLETARLAAADPFFSWIQFPFSRGNTKLEPVFDLAARHGKRLIVNRPFAMGELLYDGSGRRRADAALAEAFRFAMHGGFDGVILTGTRSPEHLRTNLAAFSRALA